MELKTESIAMKIKAQFYKLKSFIKTVNTVPISIPIQMWERSQINLDSILITIIP